jgi:hypothetical protein
MSLIDELALADTELEQAEAAVAEASRRLRRAKNDQREARQEVHRLIRELKSRESRYPLLERITANGEAVPLSTTPDEHQRGPTAFPEPAPAPRARTRKNGRHQEP